MNRRAFLVIGLLSSTALVPAAPAPARAAAHKVTVAYIGGGNTWPIIVGDVGKHIV